MSRLVVIAWSITHPYFNRFSMQQLSVLHYHRCILKAV